MESECLVLQAMSNMEGQTLLDMTLEGALTSLHVY